MRSKMAPKSGKVLAAIGSKSPENTSLIATLVDPSGRGVRRYVRWPTSNGQRLRRQTIDRGLSYAITVLVNLWPGASGISNVTRSPRATCPSKLAKVEFQPD